MHTYSISLIAARLFVGGALLSCFPLPAVGAEQKSISRVKLMPNRPEPYVMRDWQKVARDYDSIVFDYSAQGQFLPLIRPDRRHVNYPGSLLRWSRTSVRSPLSTNGREVKRSTAWPQ